MKFLSHSSLSSLSSLVSLLTLIGLGAAIAPLSAAETAMSALQALRATRPTLLTGLVEVKGEHGEPQPEEWVLLCNDPTAQGGIRELTIKDHNIISERTPIHQFEGE